MRIVKVGVIVLPRDLEDGPQTRAGTVNGLGPVMPRSEHDGIGLGDVGGELTQRHRSIPAPYHLGEGVEPRQRRMIEYLAHTPEMGHKQDTGLRHTDPIVGDTAWWAESPEHRFQLFVRVNLEGGFPR